MQKILGAFLFHNCLLHNMLGKLACSIAIFQRNFLLQTFPLSLIITRVQIKIGNWLRRYCYGTYRKDN